MGHRGVVAVVIVTSLTVSVFGVAGAGGSPVRTSPMLSAPVPTDVVADRVGDLADPRGDIVTASAGANAAGYVFTVHVKSPTNPKTDAADWHNTITGPVWYIDTNRNGQPEESVYLKADGAGDLHVTVLTIPASNLVCTGVGSYDATHTYVATLPAGCLGPATHFQWAVGMEFTVNGGGINDFAPDTGWARLGRVGYWMLGSGAQLFQFGNAPHFVGTVLPASGPTTAMAPKLDGSGLWVVDADGHVYMYGTAVNHGDAAASIAWLRGHERAYESITAISATPTGQGYWLFSNVGRVFPFGDAHSHGDMSTTTLNGSIIASVATPTGHGYYMVGSDSGIFGFGDAKFYGSTGHVRLNRPVVGIAPTPDAKGYWLVASDGGIFGFGDAKYRGSMGSVRLNMPIVGIVAFGNGYLMVASDGGVFGFSNKPFLGSLAGTPTGSLIDAIAGITT